MLISFAVSNRKAVALGFWPLPYVAEAPLYLIALLGLALGFAAGMLYAWIGRRRLRRELRRRAREIEALRRELAATQARLAQGPFEGAAAMRAVVPPRDRALP